MPAYLLDREGVSRAKVLSNTVKQKRKEKAGKWAVPVPKVKPVADDEMFRVMRTGKRRGTRREERCRRGGVCRVGESLFSVMIMTDLC